MKYLLILLCALAFNVSAHEEHRYNTYITVGVGYTYDDSRILLNMITGEGYNIYGDQRFNYQLEIGRDYGDWRVGLYWYDLIMQDPDSINRPYKLEVFADRVWKSKWVDLKVGVGYKLASQQSIYVLHNRMFTRIDPSWESNISARFTLEKKIGAYTISASHHSNWFQGWPFGPKGAWEQVKNDISIHYTF